MKNMKMKLIALAIIAQGFILVGMLVKAALPLWVGQEVRIETIPVDPRSLFRGNYAYLNYKMSQLPEGSLKNMETVSWQLRRGDVVYAALKKASNGLYEFDYATLDRPSEGMFLRGRLQTTYEPYEVDYGIEAFFAPKEKALKLEKDLSDGGIALLMVRDNGQVTLKDVVPK